MIKCVFDECIRGLARRAERCRSVDAERWSEVEARQENCSGVNLELSLWFILELFVSFFCSTSAAQSVGTGRTQQTSSLDVCICMHSWGGGV